jgi:hypothetical protein
LDDASFVTDGGAGVTGGGSGVTNGCAVIRSGLDTSRGAEMAAGELTCAASEELFSGRLDSIGALLLTGALTASVVNFVDGDATVVDAGIRGPVDGGVGDPVRTLRSGKLDAAGLLLATGAPIVFCAASVGTDSTGCGDGVETAVAGNGFEIVRGAPTVRLVSGAVVWADSRWTLAGVSNELAADADFAAVVAVEAGAADGAAGVALSVWLVEITVAISTRAVPRSN